MGILGLFGCATHRELVWQELRQTNETFVGHPSESLLRTRGSPDFKEILPDGGEVWTYRQTKTGTQRWGLGSIHLDGGKDGPVVSWTENAIFTIGPDHRVRGLAVRVD